MTGRAALKNYFLTGDKPTQGQFADFIDSVFNLNDDDITIDMVSGLAALLALKAAVTDVNAEAVTRAAADAVLQAQITAGINLAAYIQAAPTYDTEADAVTAGLANYTFYKTSTGELRYKLPTSSGIFTNQFTNQFA